MSKARNLSLYPHPMSNDKEIRAEHARLEAFSLTSLQGMARRIDEASFSDIKNSRSDLVDAIMSYRFGESYDQAFRR